MDSFWWTLAKISVAASFFDYSWLPLKQKPLSGLF